MKDCTNCRWNSRNATSKGAEVSSVASVMIDQSTPWSTDEKTCSPTVSVRDSTTLASLYQRIGIPGQDHSRYDTTAARVAATRCRWCPG